MSAGEQGSGGIEVELVVSIEGERKKLTVEKKGRHYLFRLDGKEYLVQASTLASGSVAFLVGNRSYLAHIARGSGGRVLTLGGRDYRVAGGEEDEGAGGSRGSGHGDGTVQSPMPGSVVAVNVEEGQKVKAGQALVVIESMKMQNEITSPVAGRIAKVSCKPGDQVNFGDVLVVVEAATP